MARLYVKEKLEELLMVTTDKELMIEILRELERQAALEIDHQRLSIVNGKQIG